MAGGRGKGPGCPLGPEPPTPSVSSDQQTVQDGGSALLQPTFCTVLLVCGEEASLLLPPRDPSWGAAALGQLGSHVTARRIVLASHC